MTMLMPKSADERPNLRRRIWGIIRRRPWTIGIALVLGLIVWWVTISFNLIALIFPPPEATTRISAHTGSETWAQIRRTPQNSASTPDQGPQRPVELQWTYNTSGPILAGPAVVAGRIYITTGDGRALALERDTGRLVWEFPTIVPSDTSPAIAGDLLFFGLRNKRFVALDRETGELRWEKDLGNPVLASPIVADGTVYIGSTNRRLYALDAATGQERWTLTVGGWIVAPVAYRDDRVAVASQDGLLHIVEAKTGRIRFVYDAGWPIMGSPAIHEDQVLIVSHRGTVWSLDWNSSTYPLERLWWAARVNLFVWGLLPSVPSQQGAIWASSIGDSVALSPATAHNAVFAASSGGKVVSLDIGTGSERWATKLDQKITAGPIVTGNTLLVGSEDGILYALDSLTGKEEWNFKTGGKISASPVVVGDMLYVASHDGNLYALSSKPDLARSSGAGEGIDKPGTQIGNGFFPVVVGH